VREKELQREKGGSGEQFCGNNKKEAGKRKIKRKSRGLRRELQREMVSTPLRRNEKDTVREKERVTSEERAGKKPVIKEKKKNKFVPPRTSTSYAKWDVERRGQVSHGILNLTPKFWEGKEEGRNQV